MLNEDEYMVMSRSQTALHSVSSSHRPRRSSEHKFATLDSSFRHKRPSLPHQYACDASSAMYEPMSTPLGSSGGISNSGSGRQFATLDSSHRHRRTHTAFTGLTVGGDLGYMRPISGSVDMSRSENCLAHAQAYELVSNGNSNHPSMANHLRQQYRDSTKDWNSDPSSGGYREGRLRRDLSDGALNRIGRGAKHYLERIKKSDSPEFGDKKQRHSTDQGEKNGSSLRQRLSSFSHGIVAKISTPKHEHAQSPLQVLDGSPKTRRKQSLQELRSPLHPASHGRPPNVIVNDERCQSASPVLLRRQGTSPGSSPMAPTATSAAPHKAASKTV